MLGMNTLRAIAGRRLVAKEPNAMAPDPWPTGISEQMAAAHRIYPGADPRLVELLNLVEGLRGSRH
jgi:hypothetical protein